MGLVNVLALNLAIAMMTYIRQSFSSIGISRKPLVIVKRESIWAPTVVMFADRGSIGDELIGYVSDIVAENPRRAEQK